MRDVVGTPTPRAKADRTVPMRVDVDDAEPVDDGVGQRGDQDEKGGDESWEKEVGRLVPVPSAVRRVGIDDRKWTGRLPHRARIFGLGLSVDFARGWILVLCSLGYLAPNRCPCLFEKDKSGGHGLDQSVIM